MYIRRHLESVLKKAAAMFPAVIVTGARQVGKTTLLREAEPGLPYVTLDDPVQLQTAVEEPGTFFRTNPPPVVVDEIQYAPGLFPYVKMIADDERGKGLFFMSGSQQFHLMKNVGESLAGRVGVLNLLGLSRREIAGEDFAAPFLPTPTYLNERKKSVSAQPYKDVWAAIHRGPMPEMQREGMDWQLFYAAYVRTYIERDVRELTKVGDEIAFARFMTAVAANTGNLLNGASLSRDVGVSLPTVERWISILLASGIIYLLQPYHNNVLKRALKTPKVYFLDTGLAAYLTRWTTPDVLENGAMAGAFFETYAVAEIVKSYTNAGQEPPLYFYRDKEQNEIDLLIHENGVLYPIEIKKSANPGRGDVKTFGAVENIPGIRRGPGGAVCLYDDLTALGDRDSAIPLGYI